MFRINPKLFGDLISSTEENGIVVLRYRLIGDEKLAQLRRHALCNRILLKVIIGDNYGAD